ncbi:PREDICTED: uncharacterized protein LOC109227771 [Nicotiana attenuata]|uniref:uncharacterized protein LOC109227771 n=1 Tax=Nicotiana attenuata TaxID=49451 RepID=UPI000904DAD2|nr:PREDICTED: uncharacterized protein LOC109227771 [Nicotiana attenuata]
MTFSEKPTTIESESEKSKESEKPAEEAVVKQPLPLVARPPPPFVQRLQKVKDNVAYKKFHDILKQVQINIPLVDILQEVSKYAKYIKYIVANKRRLTEFETVALTERALCDLGANINLMPLSVLRQLGLGEPRPTTLILQLADRSPAHPKGVIEDVLVQVGKMTMRVGDRVEVFNVYKALRFPAHYEELSMISVVESDATSLVPYMSPIDPLE